MEEERCWICRRNEKEFRDEFSEEDIETIMDLNEDKSLFVEYSGTGMCLHVCSCCDQIMHDKINERMDKDDDIFRDEVIEVIEDNIKIVSSIKEK